MRLSTIVLFILRILGYADALRLEKWDNPAVVSFPFQKIQAEHTSL
jgi:hypothetical protein